MCARRPAFFPFVVLLIAAGFASAKAQAPSPATVSLISEKSAVNPGSQVWIGIRFQLEPGWHIYWMNPGDGSQPPRVQWRLPAGWRASPIEWPAPERLTNPAGVRYGYDQQAMLLTRIKVPIPAKLGLTEVHANLQWLACRETCIPQSAPASLGLSVSRQAISDPGGSQQISATLARLPKSLPPTWKTNVVTNPRQFLVNFMPGTRIESAVFFPEEQKVIENSSPQTLAATSDSAQLALNKGEAAAATKILKGVLVLNGTAAYRLELPVRR